MRSLSAVILAFACLSPWGPAAAEAAPLVGVSYGMAAIEPLDPARWDGYHGCSALTFRQEVFTPFTELAIGLSGRNQVLSPDRTYLFQTSGLKLDGGFKWGPLRTGVGLELAFLGQFLVTPAGTLRAHNGAGPIVEPYLAMRLPWLAAEGTHLELSAHYPLPQARVDPAVGPRLMLTLWTDTSDEEGDEADAPQPSPGRKGPAGGAKPAPQPAR